MRHGPQSLAMIGNHLPRRCGIATFTTDLAAALERLPNAPACAVIAMNEHGRRHDYPERVVFEVDDGDVASYRAAAVILNEHDAEVVSLQHEYGIFGGDAGALVLEMMRAIRKPIVTTLHTVLGAPNAKQRVVMNEVLALSDRVVVMSRHGAELLRSVHDVDEQKIDVIPHGIPEVPVTSDCKRALGLEESEIILTFGLLSPDKGIEYVIDALPQILARRPRARYLVVGVTHPHVKERAGESYREMLLDRARTLGVEANVTFHDQFVSHDELVAFLAAADIYVTPYLNTEQITSGTLAYAVGSGKAVISTPYRYARELLDRGRGVLVPTRDSSAVAREVIDLLSDDARRFGLSRRAAAYGEQMGWPVVAQAHLDSLARARLQPKSRPRVHRASPELPLVDLAHVRRMTDDTGILQHARFTIPHRESGYCLDDNARALLLMTTIDERTPERSELASRYLAFVGHAWDGERFRNFMSYSRAWLDDSSADDCHGRALWALGAVLGRSTDPAWRAFATDVFEAALPKIASLTSPRAWAYALLGIAERGRDEDDASVTPLLVRKLLALFRAASGPSWPWFEDRLTYCNARLAQALIVSGDRIGDDEALDVGLRALAWLSDVQSDGGTFSPIGSNGFWIRGRTRARFDQQPVEATATVSACLDAHRVTGDSRWLSHAQVAFAWFLGRNALRLPVYDAASGGCRDGLHERRLNENQGAESTLSFLQALAEMRAAKELGQSRAPTAKVAS
jgi:glycosyltransferase involved in cell wall biosynthesis